MPLTISGVTDVDTDSSTMCDQHNDQKLAFCVLATTRLTIPSGQTIRAHGARPVVLVSTTSITLAGTVDVSSNRLASAQARGAGASPSDCGFMAMPPEGQGGGYGGSFGGKGGDGEPVGTTTGSVAAPAFAIPPTALRGGCPGADGANAGGRGGDGGGAVALIAGLSIQLDGTVNASGAGGRGAPASKRGGGGGGSGGMIVIDAPLIESAGTAFANGGGGGQGGVGGASSVVGADGKESLAPIEVPAGGANSTEGGNGGQGASLPRINGIRASGGANGQGGGGAGGGAAGFIRARSLHGTVNAFPPIMDLP